MNSYENWCLASSLTSTVSRCHYTCSLLYEIDSENLEEISVKKKFGNRRNLPSEWVFPKTLCKTNNSHFLNVARSVLTRTCGADLIKLFNPNRQIKSSAAEYCYCCCFCCCIWAQAYKGSTPASHMSGGEFATAGHHTPRDNPTSPPPPQKKKKKKRKEKKLV